MKTLFAPTYARRAATTTSLALSALALAPCLARAQTLVKVPDFGIAFQVPAGSAVVTRQTPGAVAKHTQGWVLDVGGPTLAGYRTNFNLRAGPAEPGVVYSLASAAKMTDQFKRGFPNARNVTFDTATVGGEKAVVILGTITAPGHVVRTKIVQFVHAQTRYTFTFTSAESTYYRTVGAFDKSVQSVRWL